MPDATAARTGRRRLRIATAWSYGQNLGRMAITTGLTLVLAVFLGPETFGVMSLALAFTGLIEMLQRQGLVPAIVARKNLSGADADTAFWLVTGVGLALTVGGVLVAPLWAGLNGLPTLADVVRVLALGIPVTSLVVVQEAVLRRQLAFKQLAIRTWVSAGAGGAVGVAGAFAGWGVWALVAQQLATVLVAAVVLWSVAGWRPRARFDRASARDLWSYSVRSTGASLAVFLGGRVDLLLAGPLFGPVVVGLYRMANRVTTLVVDVSARSIQAVSLPALAELQDDRAAFRDRLLRMQRQTTMVCVPALAVAAGVAGHIEGILGPGWVGTADALRVLAVGQVATSLTLLVGPALQAVGRPGVTAAVSWVWLVVGVGAVWGSSFVGGYARTTVLSLAVSGAALVATALHCLVAREVLGLSVRRMIVAWAPGLVGGTAAALAAHLTSTALDGASPWWGLLAGGAAGLAAGAGGTAAVIATARPRRR